MTVNNNKISKNNYQNSNERSWNIKFEKQKINKNIFKSSKSKKEL